MKTKKRAIPTCAQASVASSLRDHFIYLIIIQKLPQGRQCARGEGEQLCCCLVVLASRSLALWRHPRKWLCLPYLLYWFIDRLFMDTRETERERGKKRRVGEKPREQLRCFAPKFFGPLNLHTNFHVINV